MAVGAGVGLVWPEFGQSLAPVGRIFLKLIQAVIAPVLFGALVLVSRPRGFFDAGRDRISIGGQVVGGPPDVPHENTLRAVGPAGTQVPMQVVHNNERLAGLTWPLAERRVTVIERTE